MVLSFVKINDIKRCWGLVGMFFVFFVLFSSHMVKAQLISKEAKYLPPKGKVLLIIGQDRETIDEYVKGIGIIPAGFTVYTSIQEVEGLYSPVNRGGGVQYLQYLIERYPGTVLQIGLYMVGALDEVTKGKYDTNIDMLGRWIKEANRPVYLRIGYEFDYPQNNYEPQKYINAFRYIVERFRKNNIDNVAYVWHSYASDISRPITDWYPGDSYVDWFAISYFNQGQTYMDAMATLAKEHKKPLMIAEASPHSMDTTKGKESQDNWFVGLFDFISKHDVKVLCYINCDWEELAMFKGQGWGDARIQADKTVKKLWLKEIKKKRYLNSSSRLYSMLGYVRK